MHRYSLFFFFLWYLQSANFILSVLSDNSENNQRPMNNNCEKTVGRCFRFYVFSWTLILSIYESGLRRRRNNILDPKTCTYAAARVAAAVFINIITPNALVVEPMTEKSSNCNMYLSPVHISRPGGGGERRVFRFIFDRWTSKCNVEYSMTDDIRRTKIIISSVLRRLSVRDDRRSRGTRKSHKSARDSLKGIFFLRYREYLE